MEMTGKIDNRRPLPAPPAYAKLLGPGLVWMALAQGSGELIWWPTAIAKYGLAFLCLLVPACLLQFPVTYEISRYTVLTGEGVFRGFFRLNKAFGCVLWLLFTISFFWFGAFATAGGGAMAALIDFPTGWSQQARTLLWAQASIILFTVALLYARSVYRLIEWVMKMVAVISLTGMAAACCHPEVRSQIGEFTKGLVWPNPEAMRALEPADASMLLTAITFAGLGGFWTLFTSYWIREKGFGMASYATPMGGFRSGVEPIRSGDAALPQDESEAATNLRRWLRYLRIETAIGIVGNLATTLMTCLLAFALLHPEGIVPEGLNLAVEQARFFEASWGAAGRALFLVIAAAFLCDTWLATADCVSRIHLDALTALFPSIADQDQRRWYYALVLLGAATTSITMYFQPPGTLMITSAVIGFFGTVLYGSALVVVNHFQLRGQLSDRLRSSRWSLLAILFSLACYLALAVAYLWVKFFA